MLSRSRPNDDGIAAPADHADLDKRAASPSYMDSRVCVRALTRTGQRVIPLRCMGAMPDTRVPRDRPRWCHWTPFKGMGCRLCLGGRLQVIPCGIAAGALLRKPPMEEGMTERSQRCRPLHVGRRGGTRPAPVQRCLRWSTHAGAHVCHALGHACTLLRLSVGYADRANVPPTHRFEEHGGEKNRRRIPTIRHLQP